MAARQRDYKRIKSCCRNPPKPTLALTPTTLHCFNFFTHLTLNMSISMYTTSDNDVGVRTPRSYPMSVLTTPCSSVTSSPSTSLLRLPLLGRVWLLDRTTTDW
jgi:hypothetical protein